MMTLLFTPQQLLYPGFRVLHSDFYVGVPCAPHIDDCCLSAPNPLFCTLSGDTGIGTTQIPSLFCQPSSYWGSANGPSRPRQGRRDCLPFCLPFLSVPSQQELSSSCWFQPLASFHCP